MATVYGRVESSDILEVVPPIALAADAMSATCDVAAESDSGVPTTVEMLTRALAHMGITSGVEQAALEAAFAEALRTLRIQRDVVVARGTTAVRGCDAELAYKLDLESRAGTEFEAGRMDYRERDTVHSVTAGELVCAVVAATHGVPRSDVLGKVTEPVHGKEIPFHAGHGVEEREPGRFYATRDGVAWASDGRIDVVDLFTRDGDVDYESGNLRAAHGAVHVRGSVRTGFQVHASAHLRIDGVVEDAKIEVGGSVEVGGGIMPSATGNVEAGGTVRAAFAQETRVRASGDIVLRNAALNCFLWAGGRVVIENGRLIGGTTLAAGGVVVRELGSDANVRTRVVIGESVGNEQFGKLRTEVQAIQERLKALGIPAGIEDALLDLVGMPEEKRDEVSLLLEGKNRLHMAAKTLVGRMSALADEPERIAVTVHGSVYPNVIIQIRAHVYRVVERGHGMKFILDAEKHRILALPI